jgi:hypothetical protein
VKEHVDGGAGDVQMNEDIRTYHICNLDYHYYQEGTQQMFRKLT